MSEDDESRARVERAAEKITHHIVDHSEFAEEEESSKKRQKQTPQRKVLVEAQGEMRKR